MAKNPTLAAVAGALSKRGHQVEVVTAVLTREELAWEGIEGVAPTSISDMLVEVGEHAHGGNKDIQKTLSILGLSNLIKILDIQGNANTTQSQHASLVQGIHSYLDTRYIGYDSKLYVSQLRLGPKTIIFMCLKSEDATLTKAIPAYQKWVKNPRTDWAPAQFDRDADDEGDFVH